MKRYLAIDLGAESGRGVVVRMKVAVRFRVSATTHLSADKLLLIVVRRMLAIFAAITIVACDIVGLFL